MLPEKFSDYEKKIPLPELRGRSPYPPACTPMIKHFVIPQSLTSLVMSTG